MDALYTYNVALSYVVLIIGIAAIGFLWAVIGESGDKRSVVRLTSLFVLWGVVSFTFQLVTGLSV